ncbi:MAG: hypothetical protein ACYTBZ_24140, partial [Planctomycetota bacterium]
MKNKYKKWLYSIAMIALILLLQNTSIRAAVGDFYSPCAIVEDGSGSNVYVAENTANQVERINTGSQTVTATYSLTDAPSGVAISGSTLYVTAGGYEGKVFEVDTTSGTVTDTINVGHTPISPVLNGSGTELYVANRFDNTVSVIDTSSNTVAATIAVTLQPVAVAITPDSSYLVVANHLPDGAADTGDTSAEVSIISTSSRSVTDTIVLPNGSSGARGTCVSPDGNYAYVSHVLGRYSVHPTELKRGWTWTNAISIINMSTRQYLNTVLIDDRVKGAANPWGVICSDNGNWLCVAQSGTHELSVIDRTGLHNRLSDLTSYANAGGFAATADEVPNDLGFMQGLRERITLNGNGPRAIAMIGNMAYVTEYFSDSISILDTGVVSPTVQSVTVGPQNPLTQGREGEMLYNDATGTMGSWLSCASCHPDVRSDGFNWDLSNDGVGSPRSAKSLLQSHYTPPAMITGVRPDAETAVRAGFKWIEFAIRPESEALALDAYLMSVEPVESPYLVNGQLSAAAQNGQTIFSSRCASCHSGTYFTDMALHDVGTGYGSGEDFDTPTLIEIWRTGPYLQDGCAATMMDVLTTYNTGHYDDSGLTSGDLSDLAEYTLSIGPTLGPPDTDPPTPDPMTWASVPSADSSSAISMTATTATDPSGVEYFFDETSANPGGSDSGWQSSASYTDTGLNASTQYCYRVQARDLSANQNETAWSSPDACATTDAPDTTPPTPDPMTWASAPAAGGMDNISMTATTATDPSGVEYYFDETTGGPGGSDSGWQSSTSYTDSGLSADTQYCYQVRARDLSVNQNATAWSTNQCDTTDAGDTTPPTPDPMTWASVPAAGGTDNISMTATTATDPCGVEYLFDETSGNPGGSDSAWQS